MTITYISSGVTSSGLSVSSGNEVVVLPGGKLVSETVGAGGVVQIQSGGVASNDKVSSGGEQDVLSGGVASVTFVYSGGTEVVSAGGQTVGVAVQSTGLEDLYGTATNLFVGSGGQVSVESGGFLKAPHVGVGDVDVLAGGLISGGSLSGGSLVTVFGGGMASQTTVSGGQMIVSSGGSARAILVDSGVLTVEHGGVSLSTTLQSFGSQVDYGVASNTQVLFGGRDYVSSTGVAVNTVVNVGMLTIEQGGLGVSTTVLSGGEELDYGLASHTLVMSGNEAVVSNGVAIGTIVGSGSEEGAYDGGTASGAIVSSGGALLLDSGGNAVADVIDAGGSAGVYVVVSAGENISAGTVTSNVTFSGLTISSGAAFVLEEPTVLSGGRITLLSNGLVYYATVSSGGEISGSGRIGGIISNAGMIEDAILSGGDLYVLSGGLVSGLVVESGDLVISKGGVGSQTALLALGGYTAEYVYGVVVSTRVKGTEYVEAGGVASDSVVSDFQVVYAGGKSISAQLLNGGTSGTGAFVGTTTITAYTVSSGLTFTVYTSDSEADLIVLSGGVLAIQSGGMVSSATVSSGGVLELPLPATSNGVTLSAGVQSTTELISGVTVLSGGLVSAYGSPPPGLISSSVVSSGETLVVPSGHFASGTEILTGGMARAWVDDAILEDILADGGGVSLKSGGVASQSVLESAGYEFAQAGGSSISATISNGGVDYAYSGGLVIAATIQTGGVEIVTVSGTDIGALISLGGRLVISSGGVAIGDTVRNGGAEIVKPGGTVSAALVRGGGELNVSAGGIVAGGLVLSGGTAIIAGVMSAGQTVSFASGGVETLVLDNLPGFSAQIAGLTQSNQKIDLGGFAYSSTGETVSWNQTGTSGTLTVSDGGQVASLTLIGTYSSTSFTLSDDGHGGTDVVDPPTTQTIASGVSSSGLTVSSGNELLVQSGGNVLSITIERGGVLEIDSGGTATSSILSGGSANIYGSAIGDLISSGGRETVFSGGYASGASVASQGQLVVSSGGSGANSIELAGYPGGDIYVAPGGQLDSTTLFGGQMGVGGAASNTVLDGGFLIDVVGGAVSGLTVSTGILALGSGSASGVVISSGAELGLGGFNLNSGLTLDVTTSSVIATMVVSGAKVVVDDITLEPGAAVNFTNLSVLSGGVLSLGSGVTASTFTVSAGGKLVGDGFVDNVMDYGLVSGVTVGDQVTGVGLADLQIMGGGYARGVTVEGSILEHRNGVMSDVILSGAYPGSGAVASVFGSAVDTQIEHGEEIVLGPVGATTGTVVSAGGEEVPSGGIISGLTLQVGGAFGGALPNSALRGDLDVYGVVVSHGQSYVAGEQFYSVGGSYTLDPVSAVVLSGGSLYLTGPVTLDGVQIKPGGQLVLVEGETFTGTTVLHGVVSSGVISSGGMTSFTEVIQGVTVSSGVVVDLENPTVVSGGGVSVKSGASANGVIVSNGGYEYAQLGGQLIGGVVYSGGKAFVAAGAVASNVVIEESGQMSAFSGGVVNGVRVLSYGMLFDWAGASVTGAVVSGGGVSINLGGTATGTVVSRGYEYAEFGGKSLSATVLSGDIYAGPGGTVISATISSGGVALVEMSGTESGGLVSKGGRLVISSGGVAIDDAVHGGGVEIVKPGGVVSGATVWGGGELNVSSGGIVTGGLILAGGSAIISGVMSAGQTVSFMSGGTEDLVLNNLPGFSASIAGLTQSMQMIDLGGFAYSSSGEMVSWSQTGTSGTLTVADGGQVANLTLIGSYSSTSFTLSDDGHGGTYVVDPPVDSKPVRFAQTMAAFGAGAGGAAVGSINGFTGSSLLDALPLVPTGAGSSSR